MKKAEMNVIRFAGDDVMTTSGSTFRGIHITGIGEEGGNRFYTVDNGVEDDYTPNLGSGDYYYNAPNGNSAYGSALLYDESEADSVYNGYYRFTKFCDEGYMIYTWVSETLPNQ